MCPANWSILQWIISEISSMIGPMRRLGSPRLTLNDYLVPWIGFFIFLTLMCAPLSARNRSAARQCFQQASDMERSLQRVPAPRRQSQDYLKVIQLYRKVLNLDPTYGACDDALYRAAGLSRDLALLGGNGKYYNQAIYYLKWLRREYPYSPLRDDALAMIGDIYAENLNDTRQARSSYEEYVRRYSKSDHIADVVKKLNELDSPAAAIPATRPVSSSSITGNNTGVAATLTNIRYWSTSDYTRVVMDVDREVKFSQNEVGNPYRIYFDFDNTLLARGIKDRDFSIGDTFLDRIRVGQNRQYVARVVLDFKKKGSFTVFTLYDPYRVVIDIKDLDKGKTLLERKKKLAEIFGERRNAEGTAAADRKARAGKEAPAREVTVNRPPAKVVTTPSAPVTPPKPTTDGKQTLPRILGLKVGKIVIDPGHGGKDSGSIGYGGIKEKDVTLAIAKQLKEELESKLNVEVILTRDNDTFLPLEQRTAVANVESADLFISLHANASRNNRVGGIETFYLGLSRDRRSQLIAAFENATSQQSLGKLEDVIKKITLYEKLSESREFALKVHRRLFRVIHKLHPAARDRGVKKAPFVVLIGADIPSILVEIGFISNKREAQIISPKKTQEEVATAICGGIEDYLSGLGIIARGQPANDDKSANTRSR